MSLFPNKVEYPQFATRQFKIYPLPSCCSKPVWLTFFSRTQKKKFWHSSRN